ncbi:leucine rich repeat containing protein BspA family protein, partial [Entamoeba invadens IP1]
ILLNQNIRRIDEAAFFNRDDLHTIDIPNSVTSLGDFCFAYCRRLGQVVIGEGVDVIPYGCFQRCKFLMKSRIFIKGNNVKYMRKCFDGIRPNLTPNERLRYQPLFNSRKELDW